MIFLWPQKWLGFFGNDLKIGGHQEKYQIKMHISIIGIYNENVKLGFGWFEDVLSILVMILKLRDIRKLSD